MLRDCLEVFKQELKRAENASGNQDKLILDSYIPAEGTYLVVKRNGEVVVREIKMDKKTKDLINQPENFDQICFYDYNSQLVSMDKPQDPKKVIHSNNYLSFWVKQDSFKNGKMNEETVDRYFNVLMNPREKYTKPKDLEMYGYIEEKIGQIDREKLEKCRAWIKENIFLLDKYDAAPEGKGYLKIFFEEDEELYVKEGQRYIVTKIFNKNDYNIKIDGQILGLPNDNMGLNSKKPYLGSKTRKMEIPYLISSEEALLQKKFFDYLMNQATVGKTNIFIDTEEKKIFAQKRGEMMDRDFTGLFLQIQKGKELVIQHQDVIVSYQPRLKEKFRYQNILELPDKEEIYKNYGTVASLQVIIDDVLFSKWLITNYFTPPEDIQVTGQLKQVLVWARDVVFAWLYKGRKENVDNILHKACFQLIKNSIYNGWVDKAGKQFNLMCSLDMYFKGGREMGAIYSETKEKLRIKINEKDTGCIESDKEYFYAVGQLVKYFISLSKSKEKMHSLANPFFNAKNDGRLKEMLHRFFMKYNHELQVTGRRFNNLYGMICDYHPDEEVQQTTIIAGYLSSSLIYEKKEEEAHE